MKRVMIFGFSGAGKSTLARKLGDLLGCEPTHMDAMHWKPGWVESTRDEKVEKLSPILKREKWIIDGNYTHVLFEGRMFLADTVIFLDFNRYICLYRVIKRFITNIGTTRPDMGVGCLEKIDFPFIKWVLFDGHKKRAEYYESIALIRSQNPNKNILIFRTQKEVDEFLDNVKGMIK